MDSAIHLLFNWAQMNKYPPYWVSLILICWIVIYLVNKSIHLLSNWGQISRVFFLRRLLVTDWQQSLDRIDVFASTLHAGKSGKLFPSGLSLVPFLAHFALASSARLWLNCLKRDCLQSTLVRSGRFYLSHHFGKVTRQKCVTKWEKRKSKR